MKRLFFALLIMTSFSSFAQSYETIKDDKTGGHFYKGTISFDDLSKEKAFDWYRSGVDGYKPDGEAIAYLSTHLADYDVTTIMGTWCDDSHMWVPKLNKVLATANYPMMRHAMYALDRDKKGKNGEEQQYKVTMVPTFIVSRNGKEVGRITEMPKKSIEADLAELIKADQKQR
ncbi:MAG: thioredoxin [Sphingobacteriales bacterium]|nr:MAG: thioredoxin [Sphingobacteriales bacterium]